MRDPGATRGVRRVLFVCMGNICRSPTGEGVLRALVAKRGLEEHIDVDSAGTIGYHRGEPPDTRMRQAAARRGFELSGVARPVTDDDFHEFDLIVAMDRENLRDLEEIAPAGGRARLRLLCDFLPGDGPRDVPDPYYGGEAGFETVLDLIEAACPAIVDRLLAEHEDG